MHAAASAQIDLIDVPYLDLNDMPGLEIEASLCAQLGMTGKGAIHPKQLETISRYFTPDIETITRARKITSTFEAAST